MMKRCKNCKLWRRFKGNEPTIPARSPNACMLRLHSYKTAEGEDVVAPSIREADEKGPNWGKRTKPSFVCSYFVPHHKPAVKPPEKATE